MDEVTWLATLTYIICIMSYCKPILLIELGKEYAVAKRTTLPLCSTACERSRFNPIVLFNMISKFQHTLRRQRLGNTGRTPKSPSILFRNFMGLAKEICKIRYNISSSVIHIQTDLVIFLWSNLLLIRVKNMSFGANGILLLCDAVERTCRLIDTEVAYI